MKLSFGVEWMLHSVALLALAPSGTSVSRRTLAEHYELPDAYLAKHLKSLVRNGILVATSGPHGGFKLARPPEDITALEIVDAVEGTAAPFVCQEIRQRGRAAASPSECQRPCGISLVMERAQQSWRTSLAGVSVVDLMRTTPKRIRTMNAKALAAL